MENPNRFVMEMWKYYREQAFWNSPGELHFKIIQYKYNNS